MYHTHLEFSIFHQNKFLISFIDKTLYINIQNHTTIIYTATLFTIK